MNMKGTELLVEALKKEGVDTLFAYPGGMAIDIFDALYGVEEIEVILPRHEQGLIHAADGYARATGKVGVCLVTSGPGATNLVTGIATANYDSVPLVCLTGQVSTDLIGNDAFQEVDIVGITRNICKYAVTVRKREDLGRVLKEAFYIARSGKPGPVVVDIPLDIQKAVGSGEYPEEVKIRGYKPSTGVHIGQMKRAMTALSRAKKPLFLIGGGVNIARAGEIFTQMAERMEVPVITTIMGKGAIPSNHPLYVGNIGMYGSYAANHAISECDVLFSIGTRFNDRITGKISEFAKNATIIHVDIDSASISRNILVDIPIVADAKEAIATMLEHAKPIQRKEWLKQIDVWKEAYPIQMNRYEKMTPEKILRAINETFEEALIVTDVGQNQLWTTQYIELNHKKKLLTSGGLGTMGYGLPAAIGAKIGCPDKTVICISGDGGFQMNLQELATSVVAEAPVIICLFHNEYLGNVRQMQEMFFDGHYSSTCLRRRKSCKKVCGKGSVRECPPYIPDFVKIAESYGIKAKRILKEEDIRPALLEAKKECAQTVFLEFAIEREANVFPIVQGGKALTDMMMDC